MVSPAEIDGLVGEHADEAGKQPCERCNIYARKPGLKYCLTCVNCLAAQSGGDQGSDIEDEEETDEEALGS